MKINIKRYIALFHLYILISFLFPACSTFNTYNNHTKYYKYINEKTDGNEVKITTTNGENYKGKDFIINKDSTSWINIMRLKSSFQKSSVKAVKFTTGGDNNTAIIELADGNSLEASNVEENGSIITFYDEKEMPYITATENIRKVGIKSHFVGALSGFVLGLGAGSAVGLLFHTVDEKGGVHPMIIEGGFAGCIAGLITGAIIGVWNSYYLK